MTAGLNQTVRELQQLLLTVSRQLAKGEGEASPLSLLFSNPKAALKAPSLCVLNVCVCVPPRRKPRYSVRAEDSVRATQPPGLHYRAHLGPSLS